MAEPERVPSRARAKTAKRGRPVNLDHRTYYFNRELSWLQFNARVLEEALDRDTPLLERIKFLSIFWSNLDEFFMIRVSGLRRQNERGVVKAPPDGMTPGQQLAAIRATLPAGLSGRRCYPVTPMPIRSTVRRIPSAP